MNIKRIFYFFYRSADSNSSPSLLKNPLQRPMESQCIFFNFCIRHIIRSRNIEAVSILPRKEASTIFAFPPLSHRSSPSSRGKWLSASLITPPHLLLPTSHLLLMERVSRCGHIAFLKAATEVMWLLSMWGGMYRGWDVLWGACSRGAVLRLSRCHCPWESAPWGEWNGYGQLPSLCSPSRSNLYYFSPTKVQFFGSQLPYTSHLVAGLFCPLALCWIKHPLLMLTQSFFNSDFSNIIKFII